jgi:DNA polymerase III epsilon subunit-like protein
VLIFHDLETTGLEEADRICALGLIVEGEDGCMTDEALIKPPRKIRSEAMAVHHITNEMVKEAPAFGSSKIGTLLQDYNNSDNILLAHNINFDLSMLAKEDFFWQGGVIDTLKCSRHLIDEIERFSLQYLRYELGLYRSEEKEAKRLGLMLKAHSALSDAFHVRLLHHYLNEMADDEKLMELTIEPVLIKKFVFGKHKDHYLEEVAMNDAAYLRWMLEQSIDEDLEYSIKHYLQG